MLIFSSLVPTKPQFYPSSINHSPLTTPTSKAQHNNRHQAHKMEALSTKRAIDADFDDLDDDDGFLRRSKRIKTKPAPHHDGSSDLTPASDIENEVARAFNKGKKKRKGVKVCCVLILLVLHHHLPPLPRLLPFPLYSSSHAYLHPSSPSRPPPPSIPTRL